VEKQEPTLPPTIETPQPTGPLPGATPTLGANTLPIVTTPPPTIETPQPTAPLPGVTLTPAATPVPIVSTPDARTSYATSELALFKELEAAGFVYNPSMSFSSTIQDPRNGAFKADIIRWYDAHSQDAQACNEAWCYFQDRRTWYRIGDLITASRTFCRDKYEAFLVMKQHKRDESGEYGDDQTAFPATALQYGKNWFEQHFFLDDCIYEAYLRSEQHIWLSLDDIDTLINDRHQNAGFCADFTEELRYLAVPLILGIPITPVYFLHGAYLARTFGTARSEDLRKQGKFEFHWILVLRWYGAWQNQGRMYILSEKIINSIRNVLSDERLRIDDVPVNEIIKKMVEVRATPPENRNHVKYKVPPGTRYTYPDTPFLSTVRRSDPEPYEIKDKAQERVLKTIHRLQMRQAGTLYANVRVMDMHRAPSLRVIADYYDITQNVQAHRLVETLLNVVMAEPPATPPTTPATGTAAAAATGTAAANAATGTPAAPATGTATANAGTGTPAVNSGTGTPAATAARYPPPGQLIAPPFRQPVIPTNHVLLRGQQTAQQQRAQGEAAHAAPLQPRAQVVGASATTYRDNWFAHKQLAEGRAAHRARVERAHLVPEAQPPSGPWTGRGGQYRAHDGAYRGGYRGGFRSDRGGRGGRGRGRPRGRNNSAPRGRGGGGGRGRGGRRGYEGNGYGGGGYQGNGYGQGGGGYQGYGQGGGGYHGYGQGDGGYEGYGQGDA